ncbi:MAG: DUF6090 family protein [Cyclobacteriaceae bacterium]
MINLLRKTRQKLLSENNFSKYILYAIGEIILVVIGILIALQIDNWNTDKQEEKTLNGYLNTITKNIKADQVNLKRITAFRDSSIVGSKFFMKMVAQESIDPDFASKYFSKYLRYSPILKETFKSDLSGFESLKSSGYLSKIQNKPIEQKLFNYYSLVAKIEYEETELNKLMETMLYDCYKNNVIQELNSLRGKLVNNSNLKPEEFEKLEENLRFPSFVATNSRNRGAGYFINLYGELLNIGNDILTEMEK